MTTYTKAARQKIVEDFALRHNGRYDPALFVREVKRTGQKHPAYGWFEWNQKKAADFHLVQQARDFARDLRVKFSVQEIGRSGGIKVRHVEMPLVLSPVARRAEGGGYVITNPRDPSHQREHSLQAAIALRAWLNRYGACLMSAKVTQQTVLNIVAALEGAAASSKMKRAA